MSPARRQALKARMREAEPKVYRDRACITALEDFLEHAARRSGGASGISVSPSAL